MAHGRTFQATILDISRGGAQLICECRDKAGTEVEITLQNGDAIIGRLTRVLDGAIGVAFRQDEASLTRIDRVLVFMQAAGDRRVA
jgi:hypothetical protein